MISVSKPLVDEKTISELNAVLRSGWLGNGPKVKEFEEKFAEYVGAKYAIACNSCTQALNVALLGNGISGGELICPPMTFVSTAIVGEWNGMDVTFCDIDPDTLCLDPESLVITDQTKAIIAVDSHGRLADMDAIRAKIGDRKILLIEDAAHAMYADGAGKGDIACWSFQAVKTMPIGDGGMITTNDEEMYKRMREYIWLGVVKSTWERVSDKKYTWDYNLQHGGVKAYMTDVQAVIGIGQMRRLKSILERRRYIQETYNNAFKDIPQIKLPLHSETVQYYTPQFEDRDGLSQFLADNGIATSVHFKPLSEMDYWKKAVKRPLPGCEVWRKLLTLPVHEWLTNDDVAYIISKVQEYYHA